MVLTMQPVQSFNDAAVAVNAGITNLPRSMGAFQITQGIFIIISLFISKINRPTKQIKPCLIRGPILPHIKETMRQNNKTMEKQ